MQIYLQWERERCFEIGILLFFQYIAVRKEERVVLLGMHMEKEIL
jgi:hypothetical protein